MPRSGAAEFEVGEFSEEHTERAIHDRNADAETEQEWADFPQVADAASGDHAHLK